MINRFKSRSNKYRYFITKVSWWLSRIIFDNIPKLFGYSVIIQWSGDTTKIRCSKVPHLLKYSNRFENYTYRIFYKRLG